MLQFKPLKPVIVKEPKKEKKEKRAKKVKKEIKKKSSRIIKTVSERIEQASDEESSENDVKSKSKARANHLPPVEILFAHLNRVETMKTKVVEPMMSEMSHRAPLKSQATFHS